jgi:transposase
MLGYIGREEKLGEFLLNTLKFKEILEADLENLLYQTPVSLWKLMEEMKIKEILTKKFPRKDHGVDSAIAVCAMILNYATERQSKCKFSDWYSQTYLPYLLNVPAAKMNKDLLCRAMDSFNEENIYDIHAEIFRTANAKYKLSSSYVFYDTTAVTFEGKGCNLAERSYNAAHAYNSQINVALATTTERFPVMHKVFEGSTRDSSTLEKVMPLIEKTGNIEKTVFLVDRGITSKPNMDLIKNKKAKFIFGKPKDKKIQAMISNLKKEEFLRFEEDRNKPETEEDILYYETIHTEGRLLIYWSKSLQEDNKKIREKRLKKIEESLTTLAKQVNKKTEQEIYEKVGQLCRKEYRRFFKIQFTEGKLTFSLVEKQIELANLIEGRYAILTNTNLSPKEVLKRYRDRNFVEMSFKDLKLFINIRPVGHWKDNRVLAHVFMAILALALRSVLELKLRRAGVEIVPETPMTSEEALIQLNKVRALVCKGKVLKITGRSDTIGKIVLAIEK